MQELRLCLRHLTLPVGCIEHALLLPAWLACTQAFMACGEKADKGELEMVECLKEVRDSAGGGGRGCNACMRVWCGVQQS